MAPRRGDRGVWSDRLDPGVRRLRYDGTSEEEGVWCMVLGFLHTTKLQQKNRCMGTQSVWCACGVMWCYALVF